MEMDFHTLSRRELQALCKKNKIPANMTNLAMADALAALQQVEGLEEFLNPPESDTEQLMGKDPCETPSVARTAMRMSTRRKPNKEQQEPESVLSTHSRRSTRKVPDQKAAQECVGTQLQETPAAPATRRRVHATSARRKVEMIDQDRKDELNKNVPEDDPVMESRQKKPSVQKVYSTRRSVRLLEKTMASLTLADKTTIEPIKMNELDMETAAKEVKEVDEIKNEYEVNTEIVFAHGLEDYDSDSVQGQSAAPENEMEGEDAKEENAEIGNYSNVSAGVEPALQSGVPENETKVEDGKEENAEIDSSSNVSAAVEPALESGVPKNETEVEDEKEENAKIDPSSKVPAGVEPALSGSDVKDGDHDADPLVHNIIETALDLVDGYIVKMGDNPAIEVEEENVSFETKCQPLAPYDTSAAEISESAIEVENQFGVHTSAIEDSGEHGPSEGPLARQNLGEIIYEPQEGKDEMIFQNVLEVPSLPADRVDSSQQLESGGKYTSSEPPTDSIFSLDQLVPECNAATLISISAGLVSIDKMGSEVSAVDKSRAQVGQFDEKENITTGEPSPTEIPSTQIVKSISVSSIEAEKFAVTDPELILPRAKTPENIQLFAYSEASTDGFIMPHVEFAGETDGLPKSLAKTPTLANRMDVFSPRMAGKPSSKKQDPLKKTENILDENKENINSSILRAEPEIEKAKKINTNVDEDNMMTPLNDKSLRQLTKMLKEKLQIANKKSNDIPVQQSGKIRQALQALPDNSAAVAKTGEK